MLRSLRLGKFFGIDLYVHGTFWLLPLVILFGGLSAGDTFAVIGADVAFVFAVFGCVVLHEVGHALAARGYGIGTRDITLYPVGGVASLERMPEKPGREIAIALAGPAVNFVIATALFAGFILASVLTPWSPTIETADAFDIFAAKLMWANIILGVFNLLPCFPMDGGRVLRAVLAIPMPRLRATEIAVGVGSVIAGAFVVAGLFAFQTVHVGLVLVAIVVFLLGQAELAGVRIQAARREWEEWATGGVPPADPDAGDSAEAPAPPVGPGFTGLVWDDTRRVWIQYVNGVVVRVIDPNA